MGVLSENAIIGASAAGVSYDIDYSLRCDGGTDAHWANATASYLTRGPVSSGTGDSQRKFTLSCWVKLSANAQFSTDQLVDPYRCLYDWGDGNGNSAIGLTNTASQSGLVCLAIKSRDSGGGYYYNWVSTPLMRDPAAWYHLVVNIDTTQGSQSDRIKAWLNNEQITEWGTQYRPDHNQDVYINGAGHVMLTNYIGAAFRTANNTIFNGWDGYMAEMHALDGIIKSPSDFAELDEATNEWKAIEYKGLYGTTGIYLDFSNSGALGTDSSGNGNNFTVTGFTAADQMIDTPQNSTGGNFCTWNSIIGLDTSSRSPASLTECNLKALQSSDAARTRNTIFMESGKWYAEIYLNDKGGDGTFQWGCGNSSLLNYNSGQTKNDSGGQSNNWSPTLSNGDVLMLAFDAATGKVWYGDNGSWYNSGDPANGTNQASTVPTTSMPASFSVSSNGSTSMASIVNFGQDSSFAGNKTAQGNQDGNGFGDFYYTLPAGFLALCTANLADPSIALPGEYFSNIIYTGNGASPSPTRVLGLQPDFVWVKQSDGTEANAWYDTPRGTNNQLRSNTTGMQTANAETLKTFAATGFTTGSDDVVNKNTNDYVAYGWLAGGAPTVDNSAGAGNVPTAGSVKINGSNYGSAMAGTLETKRMSANTTSGFSINSFIGNQTAGATIAHGLSQKPDWVIAKVYVVGGGAATSVWYTQPLTIGSFDQGHGSMSFDQGAFDNYAGYWNDVAPDSSVVTLGSYSNLNRSSNIIMYSFHSVEGYSKFGSYQGNGNADGTFIYTGFRPKFFITKNMSQSEHWNQWGGARESYNKMTKKLSLSENIAEYTGNTTTYAIDFVSNGVKLRSSYSSLNDSNDYFYYAAFAESPFKTSRAR